METLSFRGKEYQAEIMNVGQFEDVADIEEEMSVLLKQRKTKHGEERRKLTASIDSLHAMKMAVVSGDNAPSVLRSSYTGSEAKAVGNFFTVLAAEMLLSDTNETSPDS